MEKRPVIGITTQTLDAIPDQLPCCWVMSQRYVHVLMAAGAIPWVVPLIPGDERTLRAIYERLDGVFLPGGVDIDPASYLEERHPGCGRTDLDRDGTELALTRWAIEDRKPLLAVCRGVQVMNVAVGGTLYQDLAAQHQGIKHDYFPSLGDNPRHQLVHDVNIVPGSRLAKIMNATSISVNSMHHQGIKELAAGLTPTALAPDGLIEGAEGSGDQFLLGVQWHPEDLADREPRMRQLFDAFITAALEFGQLRLVGEAR
ncbi:MAG: gamma-glutamyl-gamma-aminobutyrate hydrolase family protein [Gemmatimonadota bacterium]|nr:gamma-glutamyl-gamma-aminobutyrate hydrolase family protein [Gemmatimonadota bacterium]